MLNDALKSKDRVMLNAIAFTKSSEELQTIQRVYTEKYGSDLQEDKKAPNGYYQDQLLLLTWRGLRDPDTDTTWSADDAERHARELWECVESRARDGAEMDTTHNHYYLLYTTIFGSRSFPYLRQVFQAYEQLTKTQIVQKITNVKMNGDDEKGFLSLIKLIKNAPEFFADQLAAAGKGFGSNKKVLNYLIVSRSEIDLDSIADAYQRLHEQPLEKLVEAETSGCYRQALLALVRGNATDADRSRLIYDCMRCLQALANGNAAGARDFRSSH